MKRNINLVAILLSVMIFVLSLSGLFLFSSCGKENVNNDGVIENNDDNIDNNSDDETDKEQDSNSPLRTRERNNKVVTKDDFLLGSWVAYARFEDETTPSFEEQTKSLNEMGINFIPHSGWLPDKGFSVTHHPESEEWWKAVDNLMKENNIVYLFTHDTLYDVKNPINNMSARGVKNVSKHINNLSNCIGYLLKDEPILTAFPSLTKHVVNYKQIKEGLYPFINMLPSYAGETALGGTYENYIEQYILTVGKDNLEWLSHDYYPLKTSGMEMNFFSDMEVMRKMGLKYDLKTHAFPQSCGWAGKRMPDIDEIKWNVNAYLTYGFKGLTYFNTHMWEGEGCFDGIYGLYGELLHPEMLKEFSEYNWDLRGMNDILMNIDCLHAYHTSSTWPGVEQLPENWMINPQSDDDMVLSYMQAKDGSSPYIVIFNNSFEKELNDRNFYINAESGISGIDFFNQYSGKFEPIQITDNKINLNFAKGEAKFMRLSGDIKQ